MKRILGSLSRATLGALLFSIAASSPAQDPAPARSPVLDLTSMDRTVDPCTDFYQYACGGWQRRNPIPPDQSSWDVYSKLEEENEKFLRTILEQAAAGAEQDPVSHQIGDYYGACMDEAKAEALGAQPLRADLDRIAAVASRDDLVPLVARLQRESFGRKILFDTGSIQDPDDSERVILAIDQAGLGLPDRDYYFRDDAKSRDNREKYEAHVARILEMLGDAPDAAKASAKGILALETTLAAASLTRVERRDPHKVLNKLAPGKLAATAPNLAWDAYFAAAAAPRGDEIVVGAPAFFAEVSRRLASEPLPLWKDYLRFHLANSRAPYLSAAFVQEDFAFYRAYLRGVKEIQPRWKRCVRLVDYQLGEALGQAFVRKALTPQTKSAVQDMVARIEAQLERRLQGLAWMSEATRKEALAKLHAVRNKIGYPDHWRDYSSVRVDRGDFAGNVARAAAFEFARQLAKIGQPLDRGEWLMSPPTVNAYFDPQMNDMNFPAGVLQPPLYDPQADDAPNYGDTGSTVGHELTHGFDDEGRKFDQHGNLRDWWTKEDAARFTERASCVSHQYSQYIAVDDIHINGDLTLGEDVADLGGTILAYEAWKELEKGRALEDRDGLTPEQRYFVGFAQWACGNERPEQLRQNALTNPHSPLRYRVNGVVVNMPEFGRAFSCKAGAPMTKPPGSACSIW